IDLAAQLREIDAARSVHAKTSVAPRKVELHRTAQCGGGDVAPRERIAGERYLAGELRERRRAGDAQFVVDELILARNRCCVRIVQRKIEVERETPVTARLRAVA